MFTYTALSLTPPQHFLLLPSASYRPFNTHINVVLKETFLDSPRPDQNDVSCLYKNPCFYFIALDIQSSYAFEHFLHKSCHLNQKYKLPDTWISFLLTSH